MAPPSNKDDPGKGSKGSPDWADGLKQLYDSVVDEPLPDAFKDLLEQLDAADDSPDAAQKGEGA